MFIINIINVTVTIYSHFLITAIDFKVSLTQILRLYQCDQDFDI